MISLDVKMKRDYLQPAMPINDEVKGLMMAPKIVEAGRGVHLEIYTYKVL